MTTITRYTKKFAHYLRNNPRRLRPGIRHSGGVIAVAIAAALGTFGTDLQTGIEKIGDEVAKVKGGAD